ncbi:MAG: cytochrome oxidase subunit III [Gemmatimonadetes bacterium 13_1_20CM_69_28]|nr:MAG: cytochrome oxidase subunit III [Gemmatimonadetes bacterium 13_1_20CM_69_28]
MSSPYGIQSKKLAMWLFIVADASTFGAILFAYGFLRLANPDWTRPFAFSPTIVNGSVMTVVLLTSSLTMVAAVVAAHAGRKPAAIRWLGATTLLGIVFAALHLREWFAMIGEGWRLFQNPLGGSPLFGATFFGITGLHLLHVVCGVVAIGAIAAGFRRGRFDADHVETTSLYWHFVDLVWMFVFPLVYLMNVR